MTMHQTADGLASSLAMATPSPALALVLTVDDLAIGFTESDLPLAVIGARGTVRTSGWETGVLAPVLSTAQKKADGIWELLFLGHTPPQGSAVLSFTAGISAALVTTIPSWAKAIRIIASEGNKVLPIPDFRLTESKALIVGARLQGGVDGFPW